MVFHFLSTVTIKRSSQHLAFDLLSFYGVDTLIANDHVAYEIVVKEFYANFDLF